MKKLWKEFVAFIKRGSVMDMAVGVIMGSAFSAIVTALTNILLSICTWGVPGGLKGLVTVLPAANRAQAGMDVANGLGQTFAASDLHTLATNLANATYGESTVASTPTLIESVKATILGKYTLHGSIYTYNMSAVIDWGTFINAIISFLIIALTLFVILKVFTSLQKKRQEAYNKLHADELAAKQAEEDAKKAEQEAAKQAEADKIALQEQQKVETLQTLKDIKELLEKK